MRVALAALATLLLAAPAQASVKVTWPQQREYAAGERIAITVKADRKVRVAVLRVTASGKVMHAVKRRTLRRGTVRATLARAGTYEIRVGRRERSFKAVAPAPPEPTLPCPHGGPEALQAVLSADRVQRGQTLPFTVRNVSEGCVAIGVGYELEFHQGDGAFKPVPWPLIFTLQAIVLQPGGELPNSVHIPADAPLGTYRLLGYSGLTEPTFDVVA